VEEKKQMSKSEILALIKSNNGADLDDTELTNQFKEKPVNE